jgi:cardiolipin synthase
MVFACVPNVLSALRIILTVPIVFSLLNHQYFLTLILFLIAGVSDGLDGFVAKRFQFQSRLGSILDPVADKFLLVSSFLTLFWIGILPLWLVILILLRDLMIVSGAIGWFLGAQEATQTLLSPSKLSKINTVLQIMLVLFLTIVQLTSIDPKWQTVFFVVVATSTVLSGADYIWVWLEKAFSNNNI